MLISCVYQNGWQSHSTGHCLQATHSLRAGGATPGALLSKVRREGQRGSLPTPGLLTSMMLSAALHITALPHLALAPQWSNPLLDGIEGDRFLEEDRLERKPRCTVLNDTACFCAEDCKRSKPLKFSRILHFVC